MPQLRSLAPALAVAALAPALGLAATAATSAPGVPASATSSTSAAASGATTKVTLAVTGCDGCTLQLHQELEHRTSVYTSSAQKVVDGKASWTVPTAATYGLSITVSAPWDGGVGAVPVVAFRYSGRQIGSAVTPAQAQGSRAGDACFAGTAERTLTLPITVVRIPATNPPGDPIVTPLAFTSVTEPWIGSTQRAFHGQLATQDAAVPC